MKNHDKKVSPFNLDKNFFFIDSDSLDSVETEFYGFAIIDGKLIQSKEELESLYNQSAITPPDYVELPKRVSCGGFVYLKREHNKITIIQDYVGSYGIYLYKDGDYFALSNSFLYLLDKIKKTHPISFNRAYADFLIIARLCSVAYSETMVNEIQLLDRSAVIEIDISKKELNFSYIDYEENTVELNSPEGIATLDRWYNNWTNYISTLKPQNVSIDLSGGIDSRLMFLLVQGADIDLSKIYVSSVNDGLHTHKEDLEIATAISRFYGFNFNKRENLYCKQVPQTTNDIINFHFYHKLSFHKQMYFNDGYYAPNVHYFCGFGGECVRDYWKMSEKDFIESMIGKSRVFSAGNQSRFENSIRSILDSSFAGIKKKFSAFGRSINELDITFNLYRETRNRNHFGKAIVESYIGGLINYSPLLDPLLHKLKLHDDRPDRNLLIAVIFDRYNKKLLDFKFEGNRSIDSETIKYAESINRTFPFVKAETTAQSEVVCEDDAPVLSDEHARSFISNPWKEISAHIENIFYSARTRGTFLTQYDEEVYNWVIKDMQTRKWHPHEHAYGVIAVSTVLDAIYTNEGIKSDVSVFFADSQNIDKYLSYKFSIPFNLDSYITARIDIKNESLKSSAGDCANDLEFIEITDCKIKIKTPSWFSKGGKGYVIESQAGKMKIDFKCINEGNLSVSLKGIDARDENGNRLPAWIDFTSLSLNGESIFNSVKPVWHNKPFSLTRPVKNGELISLYMEWQPHDYISVARTQSKAYNERLSEYNELKLRYKKLKNSKSLRIGRKITYFPRTLKKLLKRKVSK